MSGTVAAIDLGATSGRVVVGHVSANSLTTKIVSRFPNRPTRTIDGLHWGIIGLYGNALEGLGTAFRSFPEIASVGVDSWAVDYALLRGERMLGDPYHYRDERTARVIDETHRLVGRNELYRLNGLQFLPFNTLYQLVADRLAGVLELADTMLLVPDLVNFWLTGQRRCERTNASTTGLLHIETKEWNHPLSDRLGIPSSLLPAPVSAGEIVGQALPDVASAVGARKGFNVVAVGSHDTASAVVAVPMDASRSAFISCGTWGLVGVELENPVLTDASREANFTNELGVDGRVRFLRNVMGLRLLSETVRAWELAGEQIELGVLLDEASAVTGDVAVIDVDDPLFLTTENMAAQILAYCAEHELPVPRSHAGLVRVIIESLAHAFARTVRTASELSGRGVSTVHLVGGGAMNTLLCQVTADRLGIELVAGPVEATAMGNVLVQARAARFIDGSLDDLRALVVSSTSLKKYTPRTNDPSVMTLHVVPSLEKTP